MRTLDVEISIRPKGRSRTKDGPAPPTALCIPRITRLMALAIKFEAMVDGGEVRDYANLAMLGYVSRARLTQIMNLLLLAPDIQEEILELATSVNCPAIGEQQVRSITNVVAWDRQRNVWTTLRHGSARRA